MATRILRTRIVRTMAGAPTAASRAAQRQEDIASIEESLQAIAKLKSEMADRQLTIDMHEETILGLMKRHTGLTHVNGGALEAILEETFSNEKKEIDARKVFAHKSITREQFFSVIKVQMGELNKLLGETEIRALAKITPAVKTGEVLVIKPVKQATSKTTVKKGKK